MSLKDRIAHFWDTLGVDCPEEPDILYNEELKDSLGRVKELENKISGTPKGRKNSSTKVAENIKTDFSKVGNVGNQVKRNGAEPRIKNDREER